MAFTTIARHAEAFGFDAPRPSIARRQFRMSLVILAAFGAASAFVMFA